MEILVSRMFKARPGHFVKDCKAKDGNQKATGSGSKQPGLCPRCRKGKHWVKECRSKTDVDGDPLPIRKANCKRGQPQPHQVEGTVLSTLLQPFQPAQSQSQLSKQPDPGDQPCIDDIFASRHLTTQVTELSTWSQLKKMTEAKQMVEKQGVEATPSTMFMAMLTLVSCQSSVKSWHS